MRPVAIDLFCGEGGAGQGYANAGFYLKGYDLNEKALRRYPFDCAPADWREGLTGWFFDRRHVNLIHASPICKAHSTATAIVNRANHPNQIPEVREALQATGLPYVIENVPGAPLIDPVELCGCMFDLHGYYKGERFQVYRPRLFETGGGFTFTPPQHDTAKHIGHALDVFGHGSPGRLYRELGYGIPASFTKQVFGVPWMTRDGMSQAIPPAFTEYIGRQFQGAKWAS